MFLLTGQDVAARLPVKEDKLAIDRDRGPELGGPDPLLEFAEERLVALRRKFALWLLGEWSALWFLQGHAFVLP